MQAFRKAIGVRIKEETEIIEGEVGSHALLLCIPLTRPPPGHARMSTSCYKFSILQPACTLIRSCFACCLVRRHAPANLVWCMQVVELEIDRPAAGNLAKTVSPGAVSMFVRSVACRFI